MTGWTNTFQFNPDKLNLVGRVYPGQKVTVSYTVSSSLRDIKWNYDAGQPTYVFNGAMSCDITADYSHQLVKVSETIKAPSGSNHHSFTVGEKTDGYVGANSVYSEWVYIIIKGTFYEGRLDSSGYPLSSLGHGISVHIALKVDRSRERMPVKEETTIAEDTPGESEGGDFPWYFVIPGAIGVATIGLLTGRKKKDPKKKAQDDKDEQEKLVEHSSFRMILYKEFDDTLIPGGEPQLIGARIEEITPQGTTKDRPDLTAKIRISAEENCSVSEAVPWNNYMAANVEAMNSLDGTVPEIAKVCFSFFGEAGTFKNHVIFRIMNASIVFGNAYLAFPAGKKYQREMQFGINGIGGVPESVDVRMLGGAEGKFQLSLEPDPQVPAKFTIHVTDVSAEADPEKTGDIEEYQCAVDVKLPYDRVIPTACFSVYRMHLGLSIELDALKAFIVDYNSSYENDILPTKPEGKKKFAESRVKFKLIVEDKETGQLHSVIPNKDPELIFEDVPDKSLMFADKHGNIIQEPCKLMQFKYEFRDVFKDPSGLNEKIWWGVIRSSAGFLLPPNRAKAKVTAKVVWQGQEYTDTVVVPVVSQPYRDRVSYDEYLRLVKEDDVKMDKLQRIRQKILEDIRFAELMPFFYKVDAMIEGYHENFGFYDPDYDRIIRIFNEYCSGKMGHYFINNSAWTPDWTEADENFNAFVATFGSMERSWTGIGARIVLGFVTGGVSELILTPYSALVKMQDYVNKGGDSAWEAFYTTSWDVIYWEGLFYIGGKVAKIVDNKFGVSNYIKGKCAQIKESFTNWMSGKEVGKRMGSKPGYSTRGLGERVKEAGEQTSAAKEAARRNANKAIADTPKGGPRASGADATWAEQCAKRARQDSQKILDNFQRVMNNPTATSDEIRRATLALQGNKGAQDLLRQSSSDLLRANFNHSMQKIYKEVDEATIKSLAEKLKVDPKDIQPWTGATSNNIDDLWQGRKIAADRDVTFQVRKDGKWIDIEETLMEQTYAECFTKYHYNILPAEQAQALKTLKKFDQAVVNGATGLESYGDDFTRIVNEARRTEKLIDPERVSKTFEHKCKYWLDQGKAAKEQAEALRNYGLVDEAMSVAGYGDNLIKEGVRQNVKQFKNILLPRMQVLKKMGVGKDYGKLLEKINVLEGLGTPCPPGATPLSLEEARHVLEYQYGTTLEKVVAECAGVVTEVNSYL